MRSYGFALFVTLAACGGSTVSPIDAGNGGDGGGGNGDSSTDAGASPCPAQPPAAGTKCPAGGLVPAFQCEYGSSANRACNVVATCEDSGTWSVSTPGIGCGVKNPPKCPATYASVPIGKSCSDAYPSDCVYPEGLCSCTYFGGPVPLDAAAASTWHCDVPSDGKCPKPRPKLGSACSTPDLLCDYGACVFPDGTAMKCQSGYWKQTDVPCPL